MEASNCEDLPAYCKDFYEDFKRDFKEFEDGIKKKIQEVVSKNEISDNDLNKDKDEDIQNKMIAKQGVGEEEKIEDSDQMDTNMKNTVINEINENLENGHSNGYITYYDTIEMSNDAQGEEVNFRDESREVSRNGQTNDFILFQDYTGMYSGRKRTGYGQKHWRWQSEEMEGNRRKRMRERIENRQKFWMNRGRRRKKKKEINWGYKVTRKKLGEDGKGELKLEKNG